MRPFGVQWIALLSFSARHWPARASPVPGAHVARRSRRPGKFPPGSSIVSPSRDATPNPSSRSTPPEVLNPVFERRTTIRPAPLMPWSRPSPPVIWHWPSALCRPVLISAKTVPTQAMRPAGTGTCPASTM